MNNTGRSRAELLGFTALEGYRRATIYGAEDRGSRGRGRLVRLFENFHWFPANTEEEEEEVEEEAGETEAITVTGYLGASFRSFPAHVPAAREVALFTGPS